MPDSLNKPKTVAILGAGPVGLAAAAHVLERGMEPIVLEAGPQAGARRAPVEPCAHVLAVGIQHRQGSRATVGKDRLELPARQRISDRRRAGRAVPRAAGDPHAARGTTSRPTAA